MSIKSTFLSILSEKETLDTLINKLTLKLKYFSSCGIKSVILGLSGGLDSTFSLILAHEACKNIENMDILSYSLPCFGTSQRTANNAKILGNALATKYEIIPIKDEVEIALKSINHSLDNYDVTFENAQARVRTAVLLNLSNMHQGFVLGSSCLSEIALGFCTLGGDLLASFMINASVPKSVERACLETYAKNATSEIKQTLFDVLDTPVSPELLPYNQHTELLLAPYEIVDLFLYHIFIDNEKKLDTENLLDKNDLTLALEKSYDLVKDKYDKNTINAYFDTFIKRYNQNIFKHAYVASHPILFNISFGKYGYK